MDLMKKAVSTGITPFELIYYPMQAFAMHQDPAYRVSLQINHPERGAMLPTQYQAVANRDARSAKLAKKTISLVCKDLDRRLPNEKFSHLTIYIPKRLLQKQELLTFLSGIPDFKSRYASFLCFSFSAEILYDSLEENLAALQALRSLGISIEISEFGSPYCPVLRLADIPANRIMLDRSLTPEFDTLSSVIIKNLITFAHDLKLQVSAEPLQTENQLKNAERYGIFSYLSEKPVVPAFIPPEQEVTE